MKIIKPQQLVFLKNAYKIGKDCYLGISSIAGCYLSKTDHFVTESEIWEVLKNSPISIPYLDIPVVKQFAEFVLIGNAGVGKEVSSLDAEIRVDKIVRQWRIFGQGSYLKSQLFKSMSMDHPNTWGGDGNIDNPLGTGYKNGSNPPSVVERNYDKIYERNPLASPSPIPLEFNERKKYIDYVAHIMASKKYLETSFPGYPEELDLRHFQISSPNQWSKGSVWNFDVDFNLIGFGNKEGSISGKFANVNSRMFLWKDKNSAITEVPLLFQTIWFVPDFDLAFMVYTGAIKLGDNILEEPYEYLMLSLDNALQPKSLGYYTSIYNKRINSETSLEFLLDYDLMPGANGLNVITSKDDHPYSLKYENKPMDQLQVGKYFDGINSAIKEHIPNKDDKGLQDLLKVKINSLNFVDILNPTENLIIENKNFKDINNLLFDIGNKTFKNCNFNRISFDSINFIKCNFEQCSFFECKFRDIGYTKSILKNLEFYDCKFYNIKYDSCELSDFLFERCFFEHILVSNTKCLSINFSSSFLNGCNFDQVELEENIFSKTSLKDATIKNGVLSIISFNKAKLSNVKFINLSLNNGSTIESKWDNCLISECMLNSFSAGTNVNFDGLIFDDCYLEKIGLGNSILTRMQLNHCSVKEINFSNSNLSYSKFNSCDMMVSIFKDAILYKAELNNTSAQQSIFYNAFLEGAIFNHCNFVGSNFAMTYTDDDTTYIECLLDNIVWVPKRVNNIKG